MPLIRLVKRIRHMNHVHVGLSVTNLPFFLNLLLSFTSLSSVGKKTNFKHLKLLRNPIIVLFEKICEVLAATGNHSTMHPKKL